MPNLLPKLLEALDKMRWVENFVLPQRPPSREGVTFTTQENMYEELQFTHKQSLGPLIHQVIRGALPEMECHQPPTTTHRP